MAVSPNVTSSQLIRDLSPTTLRVAKFTCQQSTCTILSIDFTQVLGKYINTPLFCKHLLLTELDKDKYNRPMCLLAKAIEDTHRLLVQIC